LSEVETINPRVGKACRHSWGEAVRFQFKKERTCVVCDLTKVTRHELGEQPWLEFWRGTERIISDRTPSCP
jgi:hypothetical protein